MLSKISETIELTKGTIGKITVVSLIFEICHFIKFVTLHEIENVHLLKYDVC